MKSKICVCLIIAFALLATLQVFAQKQSAERVTWEYKVESLYDDATIQKNLHVMGLEGWELIAIQMRGAPNKNGREGLYYFKRQK